MKKNTVLLFALVLLVLMGCTSQTEKKNETATSTEVAIPAPQPLPVTDFKDGFTLEQSRHFRNDRDLGAWKHALIK